MGFYVCWSDVVELSCDVDEKRIGGWVELLKYGLSGGEKSEASTTAFSSAHMAKSKPLVLPPTRQKCLVVVNLGGRNRGSSLLRKSIFVTAII